MEKSKGEQAPSKVSMFLHTGASLWGTAQSFNGYECLCSPGTVCIFPASPLCLLPCCPLSVSLMRLDAWLPQHLPWVATGLIPAGLLRYIVLMCSLSPRDASGLLTAAGTDRWGGWGGLVGWWQPPSPFPSTAEWVVRDAAWYLTIGRLHKLPNEDWLCTPRVVLGLPSDKGSVRRGEEITCLFSQTVRRRHVEIRELAHTPRLPLIVVRLKVKSDLAASCSTS